MKKIWYYIAKFLHDYFSPTTPTPIPPPNPPPPPPDPLDDEMSLDGVIVDEPHKDVLSWPMTATLHNIRFMKDGLFAVRIGGEKWPRKKDGGDTIGNWGMIALCPDGKKHCATVEWLGVGDQRVSDKHWNGKDNLHGALGTYRPKKGDVVGIFQAGCFRDNETTIKERTPVYAVTVNFDFGEK